MTLHLPLAIPPATLPLHRGSKPVPSLSTPPKLVIFDCDGVLVDSEPIFLRVLHKLLLTYGAKLSYQECWNLFVGKTTHEVVGYMTTQGIAYPECWAKDFYQQSMSALEREVLPVEGIPQVLKLLSSAKVPTCVASNGLSTVVQAALKQTGLLPWLEGRIFSAQEIGASKPAPDVFLHAAKTNGVKPEHCVVIEDSPSGLEAAANAGMRCFAYVPSNAQTPENLFGAIKFSKMQSLPKMLGFVSV